jgi:hypothetical protein
LILCSLQRGLVDFLRAWEEYLVWIILMSQNRNLLSYLTKPSQTVGFEVGMEGESLYWEGRVVTRSVIHGT